MAPLHTISVQQTPSNVRGEQPYLYPEWSTKSRYSIKSK